MTGRHSAAVSRRSLGTAAFAGSAIIGMTASMTVAQADESTTAAPVAQPVSFAQVSAPEKVTLDLPEDSAWKLDSVSVESEEPVVEAEPVQATPVEETASAAEETLAERQAAPAVAQEAPAQQAAPAEQQTAQVESASEPAPVASNSSRGAQIVAIARQYAGAPYVWGGGTPAGFDCSGFTAYVFAQAGVSLPRSSSAQRSVGTVIPASQAQPGDLMWWPGHVGIYTGGGQHIAARNPSTGVMEGPTYGNPIYIRVP